VCVVWYVCVDMYIRIFVCIMYADVYIYV